jgi:GNAT superfamily N-acetyltransferase
MSEPQFLIADIRAHRAELLSLNIEYVSWVFVQVDALFGVCCADVVGMPAPAYVESVIDKVCDQQPPLGIFYLLKVGGQLAGMGGLRGLGSSLAEVKRVYVRPAFRGHRLGERILARLLSDAVAFGYERACLESAPFMKSAHRVYETAGFIDRQPYVEAEVPSAFHSRWRFMEKSLKSPAPAG